ncbi:MAG: hypothetical protein WC989_00080 [Micavibrio sp.]
MSSMSPSPSFRMVKSALYPLWVRVAEGRFEDALCVEVIAASTHFTDAAGNPYGTRLVFPGSARPEQRAIDRFNHSKGAFGLHIRLGFETALSAYKDFRRIGPHRGEQLDFTHGNIPAIEAHYADPAAPEDADNLRRLLCIDNRKCEFEQFRA